jgi:epoxyqueuosine reductase QueG
LLDQGAVSVGFASKKTLEGGPSTTDMTYILPKAETAICFAIPLDKSKIKPYLAKDLDKNKRARFDHIIDNGDAYLKGYIYAKVAADFLKEKGYKAAPVINNFKYREDVRNWRTKLPPLLALRLIAARSGVGSVGWSGNIIVKGHGAAVLLGALVTSAKLESTDPIPLEDSPCDKCKLCVNVCAFRMFDKKEEDSYTLGGYTFSFSRRNNVSRCYTVCGGHSGLDKTRKWSTWSPGRTPYPETEEEADQTFSHLFAHPIINRGITGEEGSYGESKLLDDKVAQEYIKSSELSSNTFTENFNLSCGNCQLICTGNHDETAENYRILINSGCIISNENQEYELVSKEEADELENDGKITNPHVETSDRRQAFEKIVSDTFKKLRKEQQEATIHNL